MRDKFSDTPPEDSYNYKDKPLEHFHFNNYTKEEKLEITLQIERDFNAGITGDKRLFNKEKSKFDW